MLSTCQRRSGFPGGTPSRSHRVSVRDCVDEGLIHDGVPTSGDGELLPVRRGSERRRANVGYPDLNGPQSLPAQALAMCSDLVARRLRALRLCHASLACHRSRPTLPTRFHGALGVDCQIRTGRRARWPQR